MKSVFILPFLFSSLTFGAVRPMNTPVKCTEVNENGVERLLDVSLNTHGTYDVKVTPPLGEISEFKNLQCSALEEDRKIIRCHSRSLVSASYIIATRELRTTIDNYGEKLLTNQIHFVLFNAKHQGKDLLPSNNEEMVFSSASCISDRK